MKQKINKAEKLYRRKMAAAVLLGMLGLISLIELIPGESTYSARESRKLTGRPKFSLEAAADGSFMEQYETYRSDQFVGRNLWLSLRNSIDLLAGRRDSNGIFKGEDQYLLEEIVKPDQEKLKEKLDAMGEFRAKYEKVPMYLMLVPNAANILEDKLPRFAVTEDQDQIFDEIRQETQNQFTWVEVGKTLKDHRTEEIYYRTDSRWTTLGANYACQKLSETMGLDQEKTPRWQEYVVTNIFNGDLSARSGYGGSTEETIRIYAAGKQEEEPQTVVEYVEEGKKTSSLYDRSKLIEKDAYGLFLGGDHAMVDIRTTADTTDRLLLVKDSYANCLIPFLVPYYREVIVIDPQYYEGSLDEIMEENKITSVLFLYNGNTFAEEESMSGVLK